MFTRGRGNFRRGGGGMPRTREEIAWIAAEQARKEEEKARRESERKQKEDYRKQKQEDKEARKAAELEAWPEIEPNYTPDLWRQKYQTDHAQLFFKSVDILQKMKGWSVEEALETLLDILVKVTFIETNLTVNGPRTAEELFDNLQLAQDKEATIPFASPEDLAAFCDSMPINFHKTTGKRYRNTGVQGRRLVQELKRRLELGDVIDDDGLDQVMADFCKTIQVKPGLENFASREAGLDYSSWWFLAKKIPGFEYDKKSGRLSLTPESADSLPLNLPIFTDTINSGHPRKTDYSREIYAFTTNVNTESAAVKTVMLLNDELHGWIGGFYRKTIDPQPAYLDKPFTLTRGFVRPTQTRGVIEIFTSEPTSFCMLNNVSTKSASSTLIAGKSSTLEFNSADQSEQQHKKQIVSRLRIKTDEKKDCQYNGVDGSQ